jgi:acyl carrier protein
MHTLAWLSGQHQEIDAVADWRERLARLDPGVEPEALRTVGEAAGFSVLIQPDPLQPGAVRAAFLSSGRGDRVWTLDRPMATGQPVDLYVNDPQHAKAAGRLLPALREHLARILPEHLLPSAIIPLPVLPLTPNGKLDRAALPAPESLRDPEAGDYLAPRSPTEHALADIWTEVLAVERVGVHDNFFQLGGHSLSATRVAARLRETLQVELPVRVLFERATIAELAQVVLERQCEGASRPELEQLVEELSDLGDEDVRAMLERA